MTNARTLEEILDFLCRTIDEVSLGQIEAGRIGPEDRLIDDLGLDSLDYASVFLSTEAWLGIKVSEDDVDWSELASVGQLARFLLRHCGS